MGTLITDLTDDDIITRRDPAESFAQQDEDAADADEDAADGQDADGVDA